MIEKNPELVKVIIDIHRKATDYAMGNQPRWSRWRWQKLGQQKNHRGRGAQCRTHLEDRRCIHPAAPAYAKLMFENKQIRQEIRSQAFHHSPSSCRRGTARKERSNERAGHAASRAATHGTHRSAETRRAPRIWTALRGRRARRRFSGSAGGRVALRRRDAGTRLIPAPQVGVMIYDFAFGGIHDDAFSGPFSRTSVASMRARLWRFLAAQLGIPLGLLIGRVNLAPDARSDALCCGRFR